MFREETKKLASVSTNSTLVTEDSEEAILVSTKKLERVTYIQYLIVFLGGVTQDSSVLNPILALFDSSSEDNAMHPAFAKRLDLVMQTTNVSAKKINGTTFKTYEMVVAVFSMTNQANKVRFFEKTFLVANVSLDVVFKMSFLILNDADVDFLKKKLWWSTYTIEEVFLTTTRVKLVGKIEFAAATLDSGLETFVIYVASLETPSNTQKSNVYLSHRAQIAALVANKAPTSISTKYSDFANVFSPELASELS